MDPQQQHPILENIKEQTPEPVPPGKVYPLRAPPFALTLLYTDGWLVPYAESLLEREEWEAIRDEIDRTYEAIAAGHVEVV